MPLGSDRFELYTEPSDDPGVAAPRPDGSVRRALHWLQERWRLAVLAAEAPDAVQAAGRVARARDWLVRRIAQSIDEQRTLWSLRGVAAAAFVYPAELSETAAAAIRDRLLAHARTHHGWWLLGNVVAVAATAVLVLLPGPNLIGYYFLFRTVGHYLSWRGARQALEHLAWQPRPEDAAAIRVIYTRR